MLLLFVVLALGATVSAQKYSNCTVGQERVSSRVFVYRCVKGNPRLGALEQFVGCRYEDINGNQATAAVGEIVRINTAQSSLHGWLKKCDSSRGINSFSVAGCYVFLFSGEIADLKSGSSQKLVDPYFGSGYVNASCGTEENGWAVSFVSL